MRRDKYIFITVIVYILFSFVKTHSFIEVQAAQDSRYDDKSFKYIPRFLCEVFGYKDCDSSNPVPNPNEPTPVYPTGVPFPTANPAITQPPGKCMPPGGTIICGTRSAPVNGCGHCGIGYPSGMSYCHPDTSQYSAGGNGEAIDIGHRPLDSVPLPFLLGHSIIWYHEIDAFFSDGSDPYAAYQEYSGTDTITKSKYYVRFLHTQKGSGVAKGVEAPSGSEGAKVCQYWVQSGKVKPGNHVHIQIFDAQIKRWVPATNYYCH